MLKKLLPGIVAKRSAVTSPASAATMFAGTDATQFLTALGFASNISNANPGYMKLPGGLVIQWGVVSAVPAASTKTQALALTFPNACYAIVASYQSTSAPANSAGATCSTTTVTAQNQSSLSAFDVAWIAIGH